MLGGVGRETPAGQRVWGETGREKEGDKIVRLAALESLYRFFANLPTLTCVHVHVCVCVLLCVIRDMANPSAVLGV